MLVLKWECQFIGEEKNPKALKIWPLYYRKYISYKDKSDMTISLCFVIEGTADFRWSII